MTKDNPKKTIPVKPASPARPGPMAGLQASALGPGVPGAVWGLALFLMVSLFLVVVGMTPLTYNVDDIKVVLFFTLGPLAMLGALAVLALKLAPLPVKGVGVWLLIYGLVLVISTVASKFKWIGWYEIVFFWASYGFLLAAHCVGGASAVDGILPAVHGDPTAGG